MLPIPGTDLQNVYQLRTPEDANQIAERAAGKNVVIIGSSFIGRLFINLDDNLMNLRNIMYYMYQCLNCLIVYNILYLNHL